MQIFVSGTWNDQKAAPFAHEATIAGRLIASSGFDLACGPGTGIAKHVIEGFRSVPGRKGIVRFYLPEQAAMEKVGESVGDGADELIETHLDYPMRNIYQIRASDALLIVTGGDGTLEEAITALADYQLPVAALSGSGSAPKALELLLDLYPNWKKFLCFGEDIEHLCQYLFAELGRVP